MALKPSKLTSTIFAVLFVLIAVLYQVVLKDVIFVALGVGRAPMQKIEEFPYTCRRIRHEWLQGCEDLWLDEEGRTLYAACADVESRRGWSPGGSKYNVSARTLTDRMVALNIDSPGADGLFGMQALEVTGGYSSAEGGKNLDLHGFDVEVLSKSRLRFWLINHRPPYDAATGEPMDATKVGANSTVEVFELTRGERKLEFVKTVAEEAVFTPNNIAADGVGGFTVTNDNVHKVGISLFIDALYHRGTITHCSSTNTCQTSGILHGFPNGLIQHPTTKQLYVPNSTTGKISILTHHASNGTFSTTDSIPLGMPIDNLSVDSNGDVFAAGFPDSLALLAAIEDPWNVFPPSTVWRVRSVPEGTGNAGQKAAFEVTKVLEDREGRFLGTTTTAVHDVKTGMFFLGGVTSPFLTVCEAREVV